MKNKTLKNGVPWYDTDGNMIHAHGGHIVKFGDLYYWYGENRIGDNYVSCYSSNDLMNWTFRNNILTANSRTQDIGLTGDIALHNNGNKINIERPKIVYNEKTKKYIMWAHYENGVDYSQAAIALASSDTPDGDYVYHGFFRPLGHMSRDCNVFEQGGKMYFLSAANDNKDLHIYLMTEDYLGVEHQVHKLFEGESREAPALFTDCGKTYMLTSQCTGWKPNQGGFSYSETLEGTWSQITDLGDSTTYHSQPSAVLTLNIIGERQYIYIGDRWGGNQWDGENSQQFHYENSSYYFSLLQIKSEGEIQLLPCDEFTIDLKNDGFRILCS